ncbi:MAG TPA: sigma-70 family RNA polymerase sigma factor [Steroidobacteraceae bacterium]
MAIHEPNSQTDASGQRDAAEADPVAATESREALVARLFREHNQALVRFLLTRVDSEQEARDVAQEAYVRMLQLDSHGAVSFLSAYLFKTASNIAIDRMRERSVRRRMDGELGSEPPMEASPHAALQAREQLELVERFVRELPPKCRKAFYLHRLQELSPPEIAKKLGVSPRMVHLYLVRALVHVRTRLNQVERAKESAS